MTITIRHPGTSSRIPMMAAGAVLLAATAVVGTVAVLDDGDESAPTSSVETTDIGFTQSDVAEFATENGLSGGSPAGLRPVETQAGTPTQGSGAAGVPLPGSGTPTVGQDEYPWAQNLDADVPGNPGPVQSVTPDSPTVPLPEQVYSVPDEPEFAFVTVGDHPTRIRLR